MRKRIALFAYTRQNFGDDLMVDLLVSRYPQCEFLLCAPKEYRTILPHRNLRIVSERSVPLLLSGKLGRLLHRPSPLLHLLLARCDAQVRIGGSLFIESPHWKERAASLPFLASSRRPSFLIGANFGPYQTQEFFDFYRRDLMRYRDVCLRDGASYDLFRDLRHVRLAPDVIFSLAAESSGGSGVLISVLDCEKHGFPRAQYESALTEVCMRFARDGIAVTLASFCRFEGDEAVIERILEQLPPAVCRATGVLCYRGNLAEMLDAFRAADFVLATRLHAVIVALVMQKRVFPVIYSQKIRHILDDLAFPYPYAAPDALTCGAVMDAYRTTQPFPLGSVCRDAQEQFRGFSAYLAEEG